MMKLNRNMTRCKIRCGSVLSVLLPPVNGCPLRFSSKECWNYVDGKGKVGKLRTARGQNTSQTLGPRHAKVLLALGEMTCDDNDLAMAFSKDLVAGDM